MQIDNENHRKKKCWKTFYQNKWFQFNHATCMCQFSIKCFSIGFWLFVIKRRLNNRQSIEPSKRCSIINTIIDVFSVTFVIKIDLWKSAVWCYSFILLSLIILRKEQKRKKIHHNRSVRCFHSHNATDKFILLDFDTNNHRRNKENGKSVKKKKIKTNERKTIFPLFELLLLRLAILNAKMLFLLSISSTSFYCLSE